MKTRVRKAKEPSFPGFIIVQIKTREGWAVLGLLMLSLAGIGLCFYFHQYLAAGVLIALMTVWGLLSAIIAILAYGLAWIVQFFGKLFFPKRPVYDPANRLGKN